MKNSDDNVYKEVQRFPAIWIWIGSGLPALVMFGVFSFAINRQVIQGKKFGNHPMSDQGLIIVAVLVILLLLLIGIMFGVARLHTIVDRQGVSFRFFPFQFKYRKIGWEMIDSCKVVKYNPILDFGGWGIKGDKRRRVYNVSGDMGLQLRLNSGATILIGTREGTKLSAFLKEIDTLPVN
ncbi:MAG: hypothetical protein ACOYNC_17715 [Bacteroidales bacterium]